MLDITEIQTIVDGFSANKDAKRGLFNAVLYYIMAREAKPVFKANQEQIFVWATSDHFMQKFLRGLKLESWKKGRAAQLTRDNNNEFLDAVENSSEFPDWNDYRNLVKKLTLAFQAAEKEKTKRIEMDIETISSMLSNANVSHVIVSSVQAQVGRKITFNYDYADHGQNPFTSTVVKHGTNYVFSAGTPKNGHNDVMSMLDPIYPLGTNFNFSSLKVMSDAVIDHNKKTNVSTTRLVWEEAVLVDNAVSKPFMHNGKKIFAVYVRGIGFFQTVGSGSDLRYILTRDLKANIHNPRKLLKSEAKLVDFSVEFNRENYEKLH